MKTKSSAPADADIRNRGSMQRVGGETAELAEIRVFLGLLSVLPGLAGSAERN